MFEARLVQGSLLKKILEAIGNISTEANFDCSSSGISLQTMDSSHVCLVSLLLRSETFDPFRCDRNLTLGMKISSVSKILRCAGNDDTITIRAEEGGDVVGFLFESQNQDKVSDYELKLMNIDQDHLGIPDTDYDCVIQLPSSEFQRICRDLSSIGESVEISCSKEGIRFSVAGDVGSGSVTLRQNATIDKEDGSVNITMNEPCTLSVALKYLNFFTKASSLSNTVTISMHKDVPLAVEYLIGDTGHIRFYLAPKIGDDDEDQTQPGAGGGIAKIEEEDDD
ncbi:uncharacterized protein [Oscarella lobularis]|uniref:uncharacterized protein n=1 Tax=Oscarella lobularis TaxID=121494 RepID=UPI003313E1B3